MYAVTGSTGQLGRRVIAELLGRVAPGQVLALARDPAKAADLAARGVQVRAFDYDADVDTLAAALKGTRRLLFISADDPDTRMAQHRRVVEAAARAAPELIAYTSVIHADTNRISVAKTHLETERMIERTGLRHAVLRNGWYIENYLFEAEAAIAGGVLMGSTGEGRISAASRDDYAAATAVVLTGDASRDRTYELAGDESFTLSDLAAVLSEAAGRPVVYRDMPEEAYARALIAQGFPAGLAGQLADYSAGAASGIIADDSRTLSGLIGRPTETMRAVMLRALARPSGREHAG